MGDNKTKPINLFLTKKRLTEISDMEILKIKKSKK